MGVPGLIRTPTGRWKLEDKEQFVCFAASYASDVNKRCGRLARFTALAKERQERLSATERFYSALFPSDKDSPDQIRKEIERLRSPIVETASQQRNSQKRWVLPRKLSETSDTRSPGESCRADTTLNSSSLKEFIINSPLRGRKLRTSCRERMRFAEYLSKRKLAPL
jgi:hypothetical protein